MEKIILKQEKEITEKKENFDVNDSLKNQIEKKSLMNFEEYSQIKEGEKDQFEISEERPYRYTYELGEGHPKKILYIGTSHTSNGKNPQIEFIKQKCHEFKPDLLLVEGVYNLDNILSDELKPKIDTDIKSPQIEKDIEESEKIDILLKNNVPKEVIFSYFILEELERGDLEILIKDFKEKTSWNDFDYSIQNFEIQSQEYFKDKLLPKLQFVSNKAILDQKDYNELITEYGESGVALKLSLENNIDIKSPEPEEKLELEFAIEQGFDKNLIMIYWIMRGLNGINLEKYTQEQKISLFENKINYFQKQTKWENFDYSLENFKSNSIKYLGDEIGDIYFSKKREVGPVPWGYNKDKNEYPSWWSELNNLAQKINYFRDIEMINKIDGYLEEYDKIMIIYGSTHSVMQEKALNQIIDKKNISSQLESIRDELSTIMV